jgi:methionine-rich copper-binding protein CopC
MNRFARASLAILIVLAPVVTATGASAHTVLVGSNPEVGGTLTSLPDSILLRFANPLVSIAGASVNRISVLDPMNMQIASVPSVK